MTSPTSGRAHPFFLCGTGGPLLAVYYPPLASPHPAGDVLVVPPFAEEMNRCRAMVSMQARSFQRLGIGTLVLDPRGTGDSGGNFSDASWESWRDDLSLGVDWLRRSANGCSTLWGIRLGAIMASELVAQATGIDRLLFWQPVIQGKGHFTQFLRIRIAAEMGRRDGLKSTEELRKLSAAGESIEVSGYRIGPDLAQRLDEVRLPDASSLSGVRLAWFEVLSADDIAVPPVTTRMIDDYRSQGLDVAFERVAGPAFWQIPERVLATQLIEATSRAVSAWPVPIPPPSTPKASTAFREASNDPPNEDRDAESPLSFSCERDELMAILHRGNGATRRGFVIVVAGGPQYRAGAHRQFVTLARKLAARGHPVLRFDLRGMGDSGGVYEGYQQSEPDIRAAVDTLIAARPDVDEVILFGECESASGILFYAYKDPRVKGIALVNPWVRTEEGRAQVIIKHYYLGRLLSRNFWRKVGSGKFSPRESLLSFFKVFGAYAQGRRNNAKTASASGQEDISALPLPSKTAAGLRRFRGPVMILMSGRDLIAREFDEVTESSAAWRGLLDEPRITRHLLLDADHTFSRDIWKDQVSAWVFEWLASW
jgi:exosortase A-associated hydrolase 1/exosortase A-associated hydrolase 2